MAPLYYLELPKGGELGVLTVGSEHALVRAYRQDGKLMLEHLATFDNLGDAWAAAGML